MAKQEFIDIGLYRESLLKISPDQFLVRDFQYTEEDRIREAVRALNEGPVFEGYPSPGLIMTKDQYSLWVQDGEPADVLYGKPGQRPAYFVETHPNRNRPDGSPINPKVQVWDDNNSHPLHPYFKQLVTSKRGIATGIGWYWKEGQNDARDPVILRVKSGKLQVLMIRKGDKWMLPGGMVDEKDPDRSKSKAMGYIDKALEHAQQKVMALKREMESGEETAVREAGEETGIKNMKDVRRVEIRHDVIVGDWRATANSWPVTSVYLFIPDQLTSDAMMPQGMDDAEEAAFHDLYGDIAWGEISSVKIRYPSHESYIKLAILKWQELTGFVVRRDGVVGIAE